MENVTERSVNAERVEDLIAVFGSFDENTKSTFGINIRGAEAKYTNLTFSAQ